MKSFMDTAYPVGSSSSPRGQIAGVVAVAEAAGSSSRVGQLGRALGRTQAVALAGAVTALVAVLEGLHERLDQVDGHRQDDGRVLVGPDLEQRLQVAQLQRRGVAAHDLGGVEQALGGLELALGVDDLGAALALGLGLAGHGALHALRDADVLDLDRGHLHAPRLGLLVDDLLQALVELLALGQQRVEVGPAEHRAQRGLGDLRRGVPDPLDLDHRLDRVDHAEVGDRVDLGRHVVARDHVLGRDLEGDRAQVDADHAVDDAG